MDGEITIGAFEAKTRLSELLRETERGGSYLILRRGVPVARLVPVDSIKENEGVRDLFASFQETRASIEGMVDVDELIEEGRR